MLNPFKYRARARARSEERIEHYKNYYRNLSRKGRETFLTLATIAGQGFFRNKTVVEQLAAARAVETETHPPFTEADFIMKEETT
jgi:hypothetical protein